MTKTPNSRRPTRGRHRAQLGSADGASGLYLTPAVHSEASAAGQLGRASRGDLQEAFRFAQATIDALSAHICVLAPDGTVLAVNQAWRRFARQNPPLAPNVCEGANYLEVCDVAAGPDRAEAQAFGAGIRAVARGERREFELEYPCHAPEQPRWFIGRVSRFKGRGPVRLVVAHEDITQRRLAELEVETSRQRLRALLARLDGLREEERTRIAREAHDVLGQQLTAWKLDHAWCERRLAKLAEAGLRDALEAKLLAMGALADRLMGSVQQLARGLRPSLLDTLGLAAALQGEAREFRERTGLVVQARIPEQVGPLEPDRSTGVFRVFQEMLTNVARHARATRVRIELRRRHGQLELTVRDNGRGITESELAKPGSLGLLGMRERATLLGGELEIRGWAGGGTIVRLTIPAGVA